ncbi:nuclear GTPase SLIP-GC-like [Cyprinodon tularosa]|uniref:nuclear GTPase SLIP-GC-like n=1 Tax=Cyprinodon tularosa TaxID=77115 RepID=UPI0018E1EAB6|nr:nuclear GTPase SLIP-GC-like [Cyprinodon tularosa]
MDDFVCQILKKLGLDEWISRFKDQGINKKNIYCLDDRDIENLIPIVGPRALFRKELKLLQAKKNTTVRTKTQQAQKNTPDRAEVRPSTSDRGKGKRKLDQEELKTGQPPAKQRMSLSKSVPAAESVSDVKNAMDNVLSELHKREKTELNAFVRKLIKDLEIKKKEMVGVFGKTGVGKTSLINAVINERNLLPCGDVTACTSVMIKVEANTSNENYEAHIEFITTEEWKDEVWSIKQCQRASTDQNRDDDDYDDDDDSQDVAAKLSAVYGDEWKQKSSSQLMGSKYFRKIPEFHQSTKKILSYKTAKELSAKMIKYTRADSNQCGDNGIKKCYWPLVKCVTVKVPNNSFLHNITLVDLPGNGDRNKSRDTMWKRIVGSCSTVWIVTEVNRAAADKESWDILNSVSSLIGNGGECRKIHIICTKSDIIQKSTNHSGDVQDSILKRNMETKEAVRKEFNKLNKIKKHFTDGSFQVFTVSSEEFLRQSVLSQENTEIPKLQDFLQELNDDHSETLSYISRAQGILSLIQGASLKKQPGQNMDVCEELKRKLVLHRSLVQKEMEKASCVFEKHLQKGVENSKRSCEKKLNQILFPRGRSGGTYHRTLKSVVKKGGIHKPKTGREINLNMILSSFLTDSIDEEFRKTFPKEQEIGPFNGVINKFSLDTEKLKLKYKDVQLQLKFLGTEEEKVKTTLSRMIQDQKKIIYLSLTQTIEQKMQECYKTAAGYSGTGMLEKMRETLKKRVHGFKDTMFEDAKTAMLDHLLSLRKEILETMDTLEGTIELSLKADDQSVPDVSKELERVMKSYKEVNKSLN